MIVIKSHIRPIKEEHVASCGFSDEDRADEIKRSGIRIMGSWPTDFA